MGPTTPTLHVEGPNDLYSFAELLQRHGVDMSELSRPLSICKEGGVVPLLTTMTDAIRNATDRPIGFVLDIDTKTSDRWSAVRRCLTAAGLSPPPSCPATGYIDQVPTYPHPVGVWMMPDCVRDHGRLEHLLRTLVPIEDILWPHAENATDQAKRIGASFSKEDRVKAVLYCWLAWQHSPGLPLGSAIKARFLGHDSPEALAFLKWLKKLFNLRDLTSV